MKDTAILVTTFLRDDLLYRCVDSVREFYPNMAVFIGDNGYATDEKKRYAETRNCMLLELPFDCGVGGVRNEALKRIPAEFAYIAVIEDDIVFTEETSLESLRTVLDAEPEVGIAGGLLKVEGGREQHYEATTWIERAEHHIHRIKEPGWRKAGEVTYYLCDIILNVFLMRRAVWDDVKWDEQFKTAFEHSDFFLRLKYDVADGKIRPKERAWRVAYVPSVVFLHLKGKATEIYVAYRRRPVGYTLFAKKWGVKFGYSDFQKINPLCYEAQSTMDYTDKDAALEKAVRILDRHQCKWWLEAGTCLGAVREKNFIAHDPDIDIGLPAEHTKLWNTFLAEFQEAGFVLYKAWENKKKKIELSFKYGGIKVDLFFFYPHGEHLWHGAWGPNEKGQWGDKAVFLLHVFPKRLFENLRRIYFRGKPCWLPDPAEDYLEARYGPGWRTPNPAYQYWKQCRAIDNNFLKKNKAVFIGGVWDLFHVGHLNILERSRAIGTKLIVGVLTEKAALEYKPKPVMPFADRLRIIKSLKVVDEAIEQSSQDPTEDLKMLGIVPQYIVHGDDWEICPGDKYVMKYGGKVVFLPYTKMISTTAIKEWIRGEAPAEKPRETIIEKPRHPKDMPREIAVCIKTFMREQVLFKSVDMMRANMPFPFRIYIADDGPVSTRKEYFYQQLEDEGHVNIRLPFNSGISMGRNELVKLIKEPYVLITDDDIAFRNPDSIRNMRKVLDASPSIGIVSAVLSNEAGGYFAGEGYAKGLAFDMRGTLLVRVPAQKKIWKIKDGEIMFVYADQVPNFFLARAEVFKEIKWDSRIKIEYEHMDFFLNLKQTRWKAAVCLDAEAVHLTSSATMEYNQYRRAFSPVYFLQKHGLTNVINQFM